MGCRGAIPTSQPARDAVLCPATGTCAGPGIYGFVKGLGRPGCRGGSHGNLAAPCLVSALSSFGVMATEGSALWKVNQTRSWGSGD